MFRWAHIIAGVLSVLILSSLLIVFLRRWCCVRRPEFSTTLGAPSPIRSDSFQTRISRLHQTSLIHQLDTSEIKHRGNIKGGVGRGFPSKPGLFIWTDHPALITEAIENGWTRFGFTVHAPAPFVVASKSEDLGVVITWEALNGSVDFTQTIKFNQAFKETVYDKKQLMVLRTALPLPGPQLISSVFPQEAYFEITLLEICQGCSGSGGGDEVGCDLASVECEKTKLFKSEGQKFVKRRDCNGEYEEAVLSLGLATGSSVGVVEKQLPGKFQGSIGFQSDGAVYLDGMKLVCESSKHEWAKQKKVVGCGYDPRKKKVYFTLNSHLVHVINCKADEFGTPLYPMLAFNFEATILVNLGQFPFYYGPANVQRTPNPCGGAAAGLEDSKELFSIGRLDSQYLSNFFINRGNSDEITSGRTTVGNSHRPKLDYDEESDADLFEIALECSGKLNPSKLEHFK